MNTQISVQEDRILTKIYFVRDQKVMLDSDLADLYQVETKQLKRQVRRNIDRFPEDFMFELSQKEYDFLRSQIGTLNKRGAHSKYLPMAFTEQGVSMLSSVLSSKQAIKVNIQIMRIFSKVRQMLTDNLSLKIEIEEVKRKLENQDKNIEVVFSYLDELLEKHDNPEPREMIGFKRQSEK